MLPELEKMKSDSLRRVTKQPREKLKRILKSPKRKPKGERIIYFCSILFNFIEIGQLKKCFSAFFQLNFTNKFVIHILVKSVSDVKTTMKFLTTLSIFSTTGNSFYHDRFLHLRSAYQTGC